MKTNPFKLRDDCIKYMIVEIESTDTITKWAIEHQAQGADMWFDFANYRVWVIVPEELLIEFLDLYGPYVSA